MILQLILKLTPKRLKKNATTHELKEKNTQKMLSIEFKNSHNKLSIPEKKKFY